MRRAGTAPWGPENPSSSAEQLRAWRRAQGAVLAEQLAADATQQRGAFSGCTEESRQASQDAVAGPGSGWGASDRGGRQAWNTTLPNLVNHAAMPPSMGPGMPASLLPLGLAQLQSRLSAPLLPATQLASAEAGLPPYPTLDPAQAPGGGGGRRRPAAAGNAEEPIVLDDSSSEDERPCSTLRCQENPARACGAGNHTAKLGQGLQPWAGAAARGCNSSELGSGAGLGAAAAVVVGAAPWPLGSQGESSGGSRPPRVPPAPREGVGTEAAGSHRVGSQDRGFQALPRSGACAGGASAAAMLRSQGSGLDMQGSNGSGGLARASSEHTGLVRVCCQGCLPAHRSVTRMRHPLHTLAC